MKLNRGLKGSSSWILRLGRVMVEIGLVIFLVTMFYMRGDQRVEGSGRLIPTVAASTLLPKGTSVCITDDVSGDSITFTNPGGAYTFTHCKTGFTLTGTGTITNPSGNIVLSDSKPTQRVSATYIPGQLTGHAAVYYFPQPGVVNTFTINQTISNAACGCLTPDVKKSKP